MEEITWDPWIQRVMLFGFIQAAAKAWEFSAIKGSREWNLSSEVFGLVAVSNAAKLMPKDKVEIQSRPVGEAN